MIALPTQLLSPVSVPVFASFIFLGAISSQAQTNRTWVGTAANSAFADTANWTPDSAWAGSDVLTFDGSESGDLNLTYSADQSQEVLYDFAASQTGAVTVQLNSSTDRTFTMGAAKDDVIIAVAAGAGHVTFDGDANTGALMNITLGGAAGPYYIENEGSLEFGENTTLTGSAGSGYSLEIIGPSQTTFRGSLSVGLSLGGGSVAVLDGATFTSELALSINSGQVDFTTVDSIAGANSGWRAIRVGNSTGDGALRYIGTADAEIARGVQIGNGKGPVMSGSATIENDSATGKLVFSNAAFNSPWGPTTVARTLTLGGSNSLDNEIEGVIANNSTPAKGGVVSVIKADAGKWILSGTNTYTGATIVEAGTLALGGAGSISDSAGVMVDAGATFDVSALTGGFILESGQWIGGDGTVSGDLNLDSGAFLIFDAVVTLMVTGDVTLDDTFGVASLLSSDGSAVDWSSVAGGVYTLIDNDSDFSNITNFGAEDAYDLGDGRSAYFQNGSLQLVVVPEPSSYALLGGLLALGCVMSRRKLD
ncbi:autotransporter-associated beta strand repeat-containing protein [Coraliomargarita sp. W4R72]